MKQNTYKPIQQIKDTQPIRATCFHPSGETYVVGTNSKALKICKYPDVEKRQELLNKSCHDGIGLSHPELSFTCLHIHCASVYCATFNPAGDLLATGSNDQVVHIIRYNQDRHAPEGSEYKLTMHNGTVRDICFLHSSSDDKLLSAGAGYYDICLTDCSIMKPIHSFGGHTATVMSLASCEQSADLFVSGSLDGTIKLWDVRTKNAASTITGKQQQERKQPPQPPAPQQQIVTVDGDSSFDLTYQVDGATTTMTTTINRTTDEYHDCEEGLQQQENKRPQDDILKQPKSDTNTTRHIKSSATCGVPVGVVRLEPTGRLLVSGHQDGSCMLYDVRAARTIQLFQAHESEIRTLDFSPNSYYLLSGGYDERVKLTDLQGQLSLPLPCVEVAELDDKVVQVAWHPRDYNFMSTCADGSATLWMVPDFEDWRDSIVMDTSVII